MIHCDICEEKATVFLTQIIDGQMQKVNLCDSCAQDKGVADPTGFALADLLVGVGAEKSVAKSGSDSACPECGFSHADFKRIGRMGCARCYETFASELKGMLKTMHKGVKHTGKAPAHLGQVRAIRDRLEIIDNALKDAVDNEDYEAAARLRDEMRGVEKELEEARVQHQDRDQFPTPTASFPASPPKES